MARLPALPLILAVTAACRPPPPASDPPTIAIAPGPSASSVAPPPNDRAPPRTRVVVSTAAKNGMWSVSSDGKTTRLAWPEGAAYTTGRSGAGTDAPLASPDGKRVAFVRGGARKGPVVVQPLVDSAASVSVDAPARSEVLLADWSPDGRRLLFSVAPLDGPNGVIANPDGSDLRFFAHDLSAQRTVPIDMPDRCEYLAWLPSGELLVSCENGSVLGRARGNVVERIAPGHQRFSQARVGENGAVALIADDAVVVLAAGTYAEGIGPRGAFAEYQFPKPSPSGRRVGYAHHTRIGGGHVRVDIDVDGKTVADHAYEFEWLDEGTLVVLRENADPSVVRLM